MSFVRRLVVALSGVLLLQLTLLGSGTLCAMPGGGMAMAMANGAGQAMGEMHAPAPAHGGDSSAPASDCDGGGERNGCSLPWAPGQCAAMSTCATIVPVTAPLALLVATTSAPALPEPAMIESGPAAAPELPPPRA